MSTRNHPRTSGTARKRVSASISPAPADSRPVHARLAARDTITMSGAYDILGRLAHIRLASGAVLDFRKAGPTIARLVQSKEIVVLEPWPELPELDDTRTPGQLCPACSAECNTCRGKKQITCVGPGCGGRGKRYVLGAENASNAKPCPHPGCKGKGDQDCPACFGAGVELPDCPECEGTGKARCGMCRGTGRMSTGFLKGAAPPTRVEQKAPPTCPDCRGQGVKYDRRPQRIADHCTGQLEGMAVVGPITSILFLAISEGDRMGSVQPMVDFEKNGMVLLLEGERAWFYGGIPKVIFSGT